MPLSQSVRVSQRTEECRHHIHNQKKGRFDLADAFWRCNPQNDSIENEFDKLFENIKLISFFI
jgi:hypothetical protein